MSLASAAWAAYDLTLTQVGRLKLNMHVIHLVGEDPSARSAIAYLLLEHGYSVVSHGSARELLLTDRLGDAIIIMLPLSASSPVDLLGDLRDAGCTAAMIVTGSDTEMQAGIDALKAGAVDFVRKPIVPASLIASLESALDTGCSARKRADARCRAAANIRRLSEREVEILRGLLAGMSNKEMARRLCLSPRTVEMHRANLMADLRFKSQAEAIRLAMDAELTPLDHGRDQAAMPSAWPPATPSPRASLPAPNCVVPTPENLLEATTDCVFILDLHDRFVFMNQNAIDTIAQGRNLVGLCVWDVFPGARSTRAYPQMREAVEETAPRRFDFFEPDLEKWFDVSVRPITHGLLVCFRDLTSSRAATAALRMSEERLRLALDASGDGAWDYDLRTGEIQMSERFIDRLGYSPDDLQRNIEGVLGLIHHDDRQAVLTALEQHISGRAELFQCEYRLRQKSGKWCWNLDRGRIVEWDKRTGAPTRMVGTARDINSIKALEASAEEANERLARLDAAARI